MRPSSCQRVAAWLLALPLGRGGEECTLRGRLEMISFWLLCWKLLRATAGLRRTTPELTQVNTSHLSKNIFTNDSPGPTQPENPVNMEISSSPPLTDLERNIISQEVEDLHYPEIPEVEDDAEEKIKDVGDEFHCLHFEIGDKKGKEEQDETEAEEEEDDSPRREAGGGEEGRWKEEEEDDKREETEDVEKRKNVETEEADRGKVEFDNEDREEIDADYLAREETEGKCRERGSIKENIEWITGMLEEIKEDNLSELPFITEDTIYSLSDSPVVTSDCPEATLQEVWRHDLGNRDDLSDTHFSDCLQAELATVYSDSDVGEEQWAAFPPCDVTCQIERGDVISDGTYNVESKEEGTSKEGVEEEDGTEVEMQMDTMVNRDSHDEQMTSSKDAFLSSLSVMTTASSTEPDRKIPLDFSVQQETLSENVSTEHVDFLLACQQWKKMEDEVRGQPIPKPEMRAQGSFQGTHSSLYPPTRSPRIKHREPPLSSTFSPCSEDSGLDDFFYRCPLDDSESPVEREIRLTLEREEQHRKERGMIMQTLSIPRPSSGLTGRSPPRPPACRTPTLSISPSPSCSSCLPRSMFHEMTANNVIILEPDSSNSASRSRLLSSAVGGFSDWSASLDIATSADVIVVETSNLIIRSASEFCLSSAPVSLETQESTFTSNPFFKLRSISSQSLVEQEIKMVRQREEEWRRQRAEMWRRKREEEWRRGRESYDTVLVSPSLNENISFSVPEVPDRCVSSPSSPSRARKMERSSLHCDHKFSPSLSQRQNTMAQRWEASLLANQKKD